jgi:hypothetical protein
MNMREPSEACELNDAELDTVDCHANNKEQSHD